MFRHVPRVFAFLLAAAFSLGDAAAAEAKINRGDIVVVPLQGEITKSLAVFLRRAEKTAESAGAVAIIFDMDTYGGALDAAEEITGILNHATLPTYTYINSQRRFRRVAHRPGHASHLHGAGQRDRRRRAGAGDG